MERPEDREEEVDEGRAVLRIAGGIRDRVEQLGVPGLLLYNLAQGTAVFAVVAAGAGESLEDKLKAGAVASVVAVLTGPTFWAAMGILGVRAGQRFLKR